MKLEEPSIFTVVAPGTAGELIVKFNFSILDTFVNSKLLAVPVNVTLSVSIPSPPLSVSLLKIVFDAPLSAKGAENVSAPEVPVKLSEPVVSDQVEQNDNYMIYIDLYVIHFDSLRITCGIPVREI